MKSSTLRIKSFEGVKNLLVKQVWITIMHVLYFLSIFKKSLPKLSFKYTFDNQYGVGSVCINGIAYICSNFFIASVCVFCNNKRSTGSLLKVVGVGQKLNGCTGKPSQTLMRR